MSGNLQEMQGPEYTNLKKSTYIKESDSNLKILKIFKSLFFSNPVL